jgi:hypothetical protein
MQDQHGKCFICNEEKILFDKYCDKEGGFLGHIDNDHCMWMYVFFMVHLKSVNSSDHTGIESYVTAMWEAKDNNWLPRMKAITLD